MKECLLTIDKLHLPYYLFRGENVDDVVIDYVYVLVVTHDFATDSPTTLVLEVSEFYSGEPN